MYRLLFLIPLALLVAACDSTGDCVATRDYQVNAVADDSLVVRQDTLEVQLVGGSGAVFYDADLDADFGVTVLDAQGRPAGNRVSLLETSNGFKLVGVTAGTIVVHLTAYKELNDAGCDEAGNVGIDDFRLTLVNP